MAARPLSFWGWGYADRFPDLESRRALGEAVRGMLGFAALEPLDIPTAESIEVPDPRCGPPPELAPFCSDDRVNRAAHTYGKSYRDILRGMQGDFGKAPDFIAYPRTEAEVAAVVGWCAQENIACVPFGGGTSVVGGVECSGAIHEGVVCLDMRAMNRVLEIDTASLSARIQAGATGPQIEEQLGSRGLTLRHYPQSFEFSTLGGWIATRSGGHYATLYTHIDDFVQGVRMLTPAGEFATRRLPASGAGPDPNRLVLGSEGALGVITEAWMRVMPRPRYRATATLGFEDFGPAVSAVREISQSGLYPANCRLLDKREAMLHQLPADGRHVVLLGFESAHHPVNPWLEVALGVCTAHGGEVLEGPYYRAQGESDPPSGVTGRWRQAFLDSPYLYTALVSLGLIVDSFETCVTWDRFGELHTEVVREVRAAMQRVCGQKGAVTCRFSHVYPDGPAPYYTFVVPSTPGNEVQQWAEIRWAAADVIQRCGGTITHHHAVGRLHRPWYDRERPATYGPVLQAVKKALDPRGVMNPGCLIEPEV